MAEPGTMRVTVLYCPGPREVLERELALAPGATVRQALEASGVAALLGPGLASVGVGIWGRAAGLDEVLRQRDRVEIYRPLQIDPKVARRERFRQQGVRAAGLFARKKSGPGAGA